MTISSLFFLVTGLIARSSPAMAHIINPYIARYFHPFDVMVIPLCTRSARLDWAMVCQKQNMMITDVTDIVSICHHFRGSASRSFVKVMSFIIASSSILFPSPHTVLDSCTPYAFNISETVTAPQSIPWEILAAAVVKKLLPVRYSCTPFTVASSPSNSNAMRSPATAQNSTS